MKRSKFTDKQIVEVIKRVEGGLTVLELCPDLGMSSATNHNGRGEVRWHGRIDVKLLLPVMRLVRTLNQII